MCHDIGYNIDDKLPPSDIDCGFALLILLSIVGLSQVQVEEQDQMAMEDFPVIKADEDKYVYALHYSSYDIARRNMSAVEVYT